MISIDFATCVTDFYAFSTLFVVLDGFLTDSDRKVRKRRKSLSEKNAFSSDFYKSFCVFEFVLKESCRLLSLPRPIAKH